MTMTEQPKCPYTSFDPWAPQVLSEPHEFWKALRKDAPVYEIPFPSIPDPVFLISRKEDLEYVCKHPELFSNYPHTGFIRWGELDEELEALFREKGGFKVINAIATDDPPDHTIDRKLVNSVLTVPKVERMSGWMQEIIDELIGAFPVTGEVEFMTDFAIPFPLRVIATILGFEIWETEKFVEFTEAFTTFVDPGKPRQEVLDSAETFIEAQKYLMAKIESFRTSPKDVLLSDIANARLENGELMAADKVLSIAFLVLGAGNETTRNGIGSTIYLLARRPDLWEKLKETPALLPRVVEESLRTNAPATITTRTVRVDTEMDGVVLPKGAVVVMLWGSGSRDEGSFPNAGEIDLERSNFRGHTTFGHGIHFCVGNALARKEITLTVQALLNTFERIELAVPESEVRYQPSLAFRALESLPLRLIRKSK